MMKLKLLTILVGVFLYTSHGIAAEEQEADSSIVPDTPPQSCIVIVFKNHICTAFPLDEGLYMTDAHCLTEFDYKSKPVARKLATGTHLFCPYAVDSSQPKTTYHHYQYVDLKIRTTIVNESFDFKSFQDPDDLALILTAEMPRGFKPPRWAKSDDEIRSLLKLNQCRSAGYSQSHYAEKPLRTSGPGNGTDKDENGRILSLHFEGGPFHGDSGGPILCKNSDDEDIIVGINTTLIGNNPITFATQWILKVFASTASKDEESQKPCENKQDSPLSATQSLSDIIAFLR